GNIMKRRNREGEEEDARKNKKIETNDKDEEASSSSSSSRFYQTGVFDFPWLKEGLVFDLEDLFHGSSSIMDLVLFEQQNFDHQNNNNPVFLETFDDDSDRLRSMPAYDFEPLDCILSSFLD
ncbi:hypothetical protein M569_07247, partial [Genlisea aurea]